MSITAATRAKSLQAIEDVNPLFVLRYSATHKQLYNQVYKLNSCDAYKRELVKHITVKTVNGVIPKDHAYIRYLDFTSDLYARIEIFSQQQGRGIGFAQFRVRGNASLYDLSGGLPQYADYRVAEDPHKLKPLKINTKSEPIEMNIGCSTFEIAKKQEIGRGLRLPVDTSGVRCTDPNINELTVIANDNFAHFADSLQKDFNDSMNFRKDEVTPDILAVTLKNAGVPVDKIQPQLIEKLREELFILRAFA